MDNSSKKTNEQVNNDSGNENTRKTSSSQKPLGILVVQNIAVIFSKLMLVPIIIICFSILYTSMRWMFYGVPENPWTSNLSAIAEKALILVLALISIFGGVVGIRQLFFTKTKDILGKINKSYREEEKK